MRMDDQRKADLQEVRRQIYIFTRGLLSQYDDPALISTALANQAARLSLNCSSDGHAITRVLLNAILDEFEIHREVEASQSSGEIDEEISPSNEKEIH